MRNCKFYIFFYLLVIVNPIFAKQSYTINTLSTKDGLSNNYVTSVCQDNYGFIWFGTRDGLNRWDGNSFKVFKFDRSNSNSLPDNFIRSLAADKYDNLWIGTTEKGIVRYDIKEDRFYSYKVAYNEEGAFPSPYASLIYIQNDSLVWIGSNLGLVKYVNETDTFERIFLNKEHKSANTEVQILSIFKISNSEIGIQSSFGLFSIKNGFEVSPLQLTGINNDLQTLTENNPIFIDNNSNIWFADPESLLYSNLSDNSVKRFIHNEQNHNTISSNDISKIFQDSDNNLWFASWDAGVDLYDSKNDVFTHFRNDIINESRISGNTITGIFEDNFKNIWITTEEGGVSFFNLKKEPIKHYKKDTKSKNKLLSSKITSFNRFADSLVWVGSGGGNLSLLNLNTDKFAHYEIKHEATNPSVSCIKKFNESTIYIAGWGLGLHKMNLKTGKITSVLDKIPNVNSSDKSLVNIKSFIIDKELNIWFTTHSSAGISIYDTRNNKIFNQLNQGNYNSNLFNIPYPTAIYNDSKNRVWILSYSGLYMFNGEYYKFTNQSHPEQKLSSNYVYSFYEAKDGTIWIGTSEGLDRVIINNNSVEIEHKNFKYNNPKNVKSIIGDNNNGLWFSSDLGLTYFDKKNQELYSYNLSNHFSIEEFTERANLKTNNGELLFGTTQGILRFNPNDIVFENAELPLYITELKVLNKSESADSVNFIINTDVLNIQEINLKYNQNILEINYAAINYNNDNKIEYAYKLEGVDYNWNYAGTNRSVTYANLSPGEYVFKVVTVSGSKINSNNLKELSVIIAPPFWRTSIAYIIYVFIIIAALIGFRRAILNREKLKNALSLEKLRLQNIEETNLMKLRFFTNISHEFRTPLTLIKAPLEKLISSDEKLNKKDRKYHYNLLLKSTNKLNTMVNQLMDYRKLEAGSLVLEPSVGNIVEFCRSVWEYFNYAAKQKNITYKFNTSKENQFMVFDADKIEKVLSNLLSNAMKNTPRNGEISFNIEITNNNKESERNSISISVIDNGNGIPEKDLPHVFDRFYMVSGQHQVSNKGTGIGLALAKELVELHKGEIKVSSQLNSGSTFTVVLPIGGLPAVGPSKPIEKIVADNIDVKQNKEEAEPGRKKILLIDDDDEMLDFLNHELKDDFEVLLAENGKQGLEIAKVDKPNIIISDITMPIMDGIELCEHIKNNELTSHIPFILLTARYSKDKEIEGLVSGANAYIQKPFNLDVLNLTISNILDSRKKIIENFKSDEDFMYTDDELENSDQKLMQEIIDIILANIKNTRINADFIAKKVFVSRTVLYLKIEALTGQTVNEFVNSIRLKKSKQLLRNSDLNVSEVAVEVGFSSQSYFSRLFSKQFNCSPKEFASSNKN